MSVLDDIACWPTGRFSSVTSWWRDELVWEADDDVEPGARGVVMLSRCAEAVVI
jgi:hypothetical protein